jgi:hypothetical protein
MKTPKQDNQISFTSNAHTKFNKTPLLLVAGIVILSIFAYNMFFSATNKNEWNSQQIYQSLDKMGYKFTSGSDTSDGVFHTTGVKDYSTTCSLAYKEHKIIKIYAIIKFIDNGTSQSAQTDNLINFVNAVFPKGNDADSMVADSIKQAMVADNRTVKKVYQGHNLTFEYTPAIATKGNDNANKIKLTIE